MLEVNGQQYQHGTTKFVMVGTGATLKLKTVTRINYKVRAPKEITTDSEGQPDGMVIKKAEHEASMTMKLSEWLVARQFLIAQSALGSLQSQFDLPVTYGNRINAVKTDTLRTAMAQEEARTSEDNQDPDMVEVPLMFLRCDFADGPAMVYENQ